MSTNPSTISRNGITLAASAKPAQSARVLPDLTVEDPRDALIRELQAKLAAASAPRAITCKVTDKGGLSLYGLGRFPVTLYASQWRKLFASAKDIQAFMAAHASELTEKD